MATITIYGDSPGAPSPMKVRSWDEDFNGLGANRTSSDGDDPTIYDDPTNGITEQKAEEIAGDGWRVTVA